MQNFILKILLNKALNNLVDLSTQMYERF